MIVSSDGSGDRSKRKKGYLENKGANLFAQRTVHLEWLGARNGDPIPR